MTDDDTRERVREAIGEADVVLSDMAPNMSGEYELDHARSVHLARQAFETAREVLAPGGDLVVKVFDGPDLPALREEMEGEFQYVRSTRPAATRDASSEQYLLARGHITAPVRPGDRVEVTVRDTGSEGDGVVAVEGFRLFVPGVDEGETVEVRVTDVKPHYGFAERVEPE
jgi:23S rRNA (uridine2552-2'-O)-methyltransferase